MVILLALLDEVCNDASFIKFVLLVRYLLPFYHKNAMDRVNLCYRYQPWSSVVSVWQHLAMFTVSGFASVTPDFSNQGSSGPWYKTD